MEYFIIGTNNLTDARYFSAMGVKYLHFDLDPGSPYAIGEADFRGIIEWIEGSDVVCSFDHLFDEEEIKSIIGLPAVRGVLSRYPDMLDFVRRIHPEIKLFQNIFTGNHADPDLPLTAVISEEMPVSDLPWFKFCKDIENAALEETRGNCAGLAFHPGGEEEVGIKDYDLFDRLLQGDI